MAAPLKIVNWRLSGTKNLRTLLADSMNSENSWAGDFSIATSGSPTASKESIGFPQYGQKSESVSTTSFLQCGHFPLLFLLWLLWPSAPIFISGKTSTPPHEGHNSIPSLRLTKAPQWGHVSSFFFDISTAWSLINSLLTAERGATGLGIEPNWGRIWSNSDSKRSLKPLYERYSIWTW